VGVRLTAWLVFRVRALASARAGEDALERARLKFPTAAIAVLEFTGTWQELGQNGPG
jgi:phosphohistidine phosphatase SixA